VDALLADGDATPNGLQHAVVVQVPLAYMRRGATALGLVIQLSKLSIHLDPVNKGKVFGHMPLVQQDC
jgi:hypothetical protein